MTSWQDISDAEPEFAARAQALFDSRTHKVLATLRRDGSPRLSGIEVTFSDGDVWIGSMPGSRKNDDLARDPRLAVHVSSDDPPRDNPSAWAGDAKLSGVAQFVDDPRRLRSMSTAEDPANDSDDDPGGLLYRIDITEVVVTRVAPTNDHLLIESWTPSNGYRRIKRF